MADTTATGPTLPDHPGPEITTSKAQLSSDINTANAELYARMEQLKADMAVAQAKAQGKQQLATARHIATLQQLASDQADYGATGLGQRAPAQPTAPPPMLPTVNVNPTQPMSGAPTPSDMAAQFGSLVSGSGGDPGLAAGGGAARQVLEAAKAGQGPGAPGAGGPPMLTMPAPQLPTPGPPQMGNPSITMGPGQTYTAPPFVPTTTVANRSGSVVEGGQRMPVNDTTVTSEMRPNVLSPGDILQARIAQERMANERSSQQMEASINWGRARAQATAELAQHVSPALASQAADSLLRGDLVGVANTLKGSVTYEQERINIDRGVANASILKDRAATDTYRRQLVETDARTRLLTAQAQEAEDKNRIITGMFGPGGLSSSTSNASAVMGIGPTLGQVTGTPILAPWKMGIGGLPEFNSEKIIENVSKATKTLADTLTGSMVDSSKQGYLPPSSVQLGILESAKGFAQGQQVLVQTAKDVSGSLNPFASNQPGYGTVPWGQFITAWAIAHEDPTHLTGIPPEQAAAAKQLVEQWGLGSFDAQGYHLPAPTSAMYQWARQLDQGYKDAANTGEFVPNTIRNTLQKDPEALTRPPTTVSGLFAPGTSPKDVELQGRQQEAIDNYTKLRQAQEDLWSAKYEGLDTKEPAVFATLQRHVDEYESRRRELPEINSAKLAPLLRGVGRVAGSAGAVLGSAATGLISTAQGLGASGPTALNTPGSQAVSMGQQAYQAYNAQSAKVALERNARWEQYRRETQGQ